MASSDDESELFTFLVRSAARDDTKTTAVGRGVHSVNTTNGCQGVNSRDATRDGAWTTVAGASATKVKGAARDGATTTGAARDGAMTGIHGDDDTTRAP